MNVQKGQVLAMIFAELSNILVDLKDGVN